MCVNLTKIMSGQEKTRKDWGEGSLAFSLQSPRFYSFLASQFSLCRSPLSERPEIVENRVEQRRTHPISSVSSPPPRAAETNS